MTHKLAEPYSGKNPVPKIATKLTSLLNPERATEAKAAQLQDQSAKKDEKQTEKRASRLSKGYVMRVVDPVTGEELDIKNADEEPDLRNKGENVLDTDFPPPDWEQHRQEVVSVVNPSIIAIALAYIVCLSVSRLISTSVWSTGVAILVPTLLTYSLNFRIHRLSKVDFDDRAWHAERMRGLRAGSDVDDDGKVSEEERTKESAEWVNAMLRGVWPIMNPDLFSGVVDILEDIMQASVPHFIHSVRIADLGLGSNAARITAIRSLPDNESHEFQEQQDEKHKCPEEREELDDKHVNIEVSFAYRGLPSGKSAFQKAKNIHLLVEFFMGIRGLYGVKIPIWVEVTGAIGTARARLQLISDPPFVKKSMITLLGLPRVTISVVTLHKMLPNIMNIPFVSGFVSSAIDTAAAEYVAPKSLTLDLQRLISGDDIKKDTDAIGVLVVHIHRAQGVRRADASGGSDPYLIMTYSRLGKPLYSTRIIKGDCNPIFEETAVVLVDVNTIRLKEKLSFQLWDSDRMSVDDLLGVAEVDVVDLVRNKAQAHRRKSTLTDPRSSHTPGTLEYTVGYYGKRAPAESLRTNGIDPGIPKDLQDRPEFQNAKEIAMNDLEAAVLVTPPDPEWPSGILSVQLHEIRGLGLKKEGREKNLLKSGQSREGHKGQDDDMQEMEEMEGLPSSYCTISLNDELVYQTRVKPITSTPIFNAGTERFVKDWRTAHVSVTVKDSRMRENDAVLGVIMLKLSELLVNASQITRLFSMEQGLGYGRIRLSLLFRPVGAKLPLNLIGFDTGMLMVQDVSIKVTDESMKMNLAKCVLRMKTTKANHEEKVSRRTGTQREDGMLTWAPEDDDSSLKGLPVRTRYSSALVMSFKESSAAAGLTRIGRKAMAILWLRDLEDNDDKTMELPLWHVTDSDYSRLKMNYSPPDGNLDAWDADKEKLIRVGSIWIRLKFKPGIGEGHHDTMNGGGSKRREAWEAYTREQEGGLRESVGEIGSDMREQASRPENFTDSRRESHHSPPSEEGSVDDSPLHTPTSQEGHDRVHEESRPEPTTLVSSSAVENEEIGRHGQDHHAGEEEESEEEDGQDKGVVNKFKHWKQHQKDLHRDHRGIMQAKPARTFEWVKDNVEEGAHALRDRFSMKSRKPDVETEV